MPLLPLAVEADGVSTVQPYAEYHTWGRNDKHIQQARSDTMTLCCPRRLGSSGCRCAQGGRSAAQAATCAAARCLRLCSTIHGQGRELRDKLLISRKACRYPDATPCGCCLCTRPPDEADAQALRAAVLLDELPTPANAAPGAIVVEAKESNALRLVQSTCSRRVLAVPTTALAAFRWCSEPWMDLRRL